MERLSYLFKISKNGYEIKIFFVSQGEASIVNPVREFINLYSTGFIKYSLGVLTKSNFTITISSFAGKLFLKYKF